MPHYYIGLTLLGAITSLVPVYTGTVTAWQRVD